MLRPPALLLALLLAPLAARGQAGASDSPSGFVLTAGLGGGGSVGAASQYTRTGVFEAELTGGWELPLGIRPELSMALGFAPRSYFALRPGLHVALPDLPFYARAAVDVSSVTGTTTWHWLLLGGGGELRFTDVAGLFAEADLGIPLRDGVGLGLLLRGGVAFRF